MAQHSDQKRTQNLKHLFIGWHRQTFWPFILQWQSLKWQGNGAVGSLLIESLINFKIRSENAMGGR
jgi:hypothetical protein